MTLHTIDDVRHVLKAKANLMADQIMVRDSIPRDRAVKRAYAEILTEVIKKHWEQK